MISSILRITVPVLFICAITSCTLQGSFSLGEPEPVTTGFQFTEGPHWLDEGSLIFSDIPANRIYKWTPGSTESSIFVDSTGNSNGIDSMPDGTLVLAQHAGRVSMLNEDGVLEPLAQSYDGKRLNSPNDLAIRSDGTIYFTDPTFGVSSEERELDFAGVYRIDTNGQVHLVYDGFSLPNGVALTPDEDALYVNDSETGTVVRFEILDSGEAVNLQEFANIGAMSEMGGADGMITDREGRLYTTGPNGLIVFDANGTEVARLEFDQQITNLEWGGENGNTLFVTSVGDVFQIPVEK